MAALRRHREVLGPCPEDALVEGFLLGHVARETVLRKFGPERLDEIEHQRDALRRDVTPISKKPGSGSAMLKFVVVLYRRPDLSPEEFFTNLRNEHGPLAERLPSLRRYVQNHVLPDPKREHPGWDAVIELYWDDRDAMEAAWASPEGQAATDHLRTLSDLSRTTWSVVQEQVRR